MHGQQELDLISSVRKLKGTQNWVVGKGAVSLEGVGGEHGRILKALRKETAKSFSGPDNIRAAAEIVCGDNAPLLRNPSRS